MKHPTDVPAFLVTGAGGFIGNRLVENLINDGERVVAFDNSAFPSIKHKNLINVKGDILKVQDLIKTIETYNVRAIVHLAALLIPGCKESPARGAEINTVGHINVLEAARLLDVKKVVYASSIAALPRPPLNSPSTVYGALKHCNEEISKIFFNDHGLITIGLRPVILYGPGREIGETAPITLAMKAAALGTPYTIPFIEKTCFQHIDETIEIFSRCLRSNPNQPIISDMGTTLHTTNDVANAINELLPNALVKVGQTERQGPTNLDGSKLIELLGRWPSISLKSGVKRTIAFYKSQETPI